jgi:2-methylcitrate dehydratase PrpD
VGFEVATRLAAAVNPGQYHYGWHTTAIAGVLGATATAGRLLGLSPEQLQHALGIATSEAAGSRCNVGSDTMPLHSGRAARSGVLSALLARRGFTAEINALETPMGWLALFRGEGDVQAEDILTDLGQDFALERPELSFKFYANSTSTHRFIDATLVLRQQGVTADQVQRLLCTVSPASKQPLRYAQPRTAQQARVSLPYAVAVALCDGEAGLRQFNQSRVQAADVQAMLQRVVVQEDSTLSVTEGADFVAFPATVQAELLDGRVVTATVEHARGSPQHPPRRPEFEAKFRQCARDVLSSEQTLLAMRYLYQLETLPAWRQVLDALSLADTGT